MKTRRTFLASVLCAPFAAVGLMKPKKKAVQLADFKVKIECDTSDFDKKFGQIAAQLHGVTVRQGNLAADLVNPNQLFQEEIERAITVHV